MNERINESHPLADGLVAAHTYTSGSVESRVVPGLTWQAAAAEGLKELLSRNHDEWWLSGLQYNLWQTEDGVIHVQFVNPEET